MGIINGPVLVCDDCDTLIVSGDAVARVIFSEFVNIVPGVPGLSGLSTPWAFYDPSTESAAERVYHKDCALALLDDEDEDCDDPECCGTVCDDACCEQPSAPADFGRIDITPIVDAWRPSYGRTDVTGI